MMLHAETATAQLREAGLRLTPQRRAVIEALAGDTSHPLADDVARKVAERVPGVSLSTVYKTLHELASAGLIKELGLPGSMRFDPDVSSHAHLVCDGCGTVVDVQLPAQATEALLGSADPAQISSIEVTLHGTCGSCPVQ